MEETLATNQTLIEIFKDSNTESKTICFYNFMIISNNKSKWGIIEEAKKNDMAILNEQIETTKEIEKIIDEDDHRTVLHYLALNQNTFIFIKLLRKYDESQNKEWLQKKDKYGLEAIHYFIYKGKVDVLNHISPIYKPKNLLGMAAIQNDIMSMIILKEKMEESEKISDAYQNNVTPLHLVCQSKSDYAALVLMKWKHPLNVKDSQGNTPLHIAANNGSYKLIRKLIQRGGSISVKNNNNQLPMDLAKDEQTIEALKSFRFSWKSLLLKLNIKPRKRSPVQTFIFLFFFSLANAGTIFLAYNSLYVDQITGNLIFIIVISSLCFLSYILVSYSNPGYAKMKDEKNLKEILQQFQSFEICYDCFIKPPNRSKHCEFCKRCVILYDHHCPWINNCVGKDNQSLFYLFLFFLVVDFILLVVLGIFALLSEASNNQNTSFIILIVLTAIEFLFLFPLINLIVTQILNNFYGLTTYERLILGKPLTKKRESIINKISAQDENEK
ncbi:unnamed protein product [Paramecium sonneborni]|uniref:Palmitoyltransferase n=1 Tax=Paramecium sonneborni TaxID=65129 RepID=A0A8S1NN61_9CILI|nr:unnamed protein product [Paramecium sonneborni]